MPAFQEQIERSIAERALVSVRRRRIDGRAIQGFPLAVSPRLVLLQYVFDFHLDGFLVLRRSDLTDWQTGGTNAFQRGLLAEEGVLEQVQFDFCPPLGSFAGFLGSRAATELVIVESERTDPPVLSLGTVVSVDHRAVTLQHFTGTGRAEETPRTMALADVTSCQIRTNYLGFYQRYLDRLTR